MPRVHHVKRARKPNPVVTQKDIDFANSEESGENSKAASYYWWKFRHGGKRFSRQYPDRSQLTQSNYYATVWATEDSVTASSPGDIGEAVEVLEGAKGDIEGLKDEVEDSICNMEGCEGLNASPVFYQLEERRDRMEELCDQIDEARDAMQEHDLEELWKEEHQDIIEAAESARPEDVECEECGGSGCNGFPDDDGNEGDCETCDGAGVVEDRTDMDAAQDELAGIEDNRDEWMNTKASELFAEAIEVIDWDTGE